MRLIALKGATCYELQVNQFWIKVLRPRFWCRRNILRLVQVGLDKPELCDACWEPKP